MKKIDLHIHTVATVSDSPFTFSLETFKRYVLEARLDAVAVTNHDMFDVEQFRQIQGAIPSTAVFPGIEVNVEKGHVLIIADASDLSTFEPKTKQVTAKIKKQGDSISTADLQAIFADLSKYLVIPHYDKWPEITGETLDVLMPYVVAGEVDSAKKFVRLMRDNSKITPVLFSDSRMRHDLERLPTRQTFIDCGDVTLTALKMSLRDKAKVTLSERDGNKLWPVFQNGQQLSTGLNVILGGRSTGKTHTLDELQETLGSDKVKYIKQFALVQQTDVANERDFKNDLERRRSVFADDHLSALKAVVDDVMKVDLIANAKGVERYVETLLKSADELDRRDAFSKANLFGEIDFPESSTPTLKELIESVRQVIENVEFREVIERHISTDSLKRLISELIELLWAKTLDLKKKKFVNNVVRDVKQNLKLLTAATQIEDVDLYKYSMDERRVARFTEIVELLKQEAIIQNEGIQGFRVETTRKPFESASEIKAVSRVNTSYRDAFAKYANPYEYLRELLSDPNLTPSELYKLFVKISCRVVNKDGFEVSGGERSEFRLLQQIADAQNYDILLIDEPESSFDNLFLNSDVNQLLKGISKSMPVVVVTHNSTVGASIGADYLLHTRKELESGKPVYRIYSGYPTDKTLRSTDGRSIATHDLMLDSLEAGSATYESRRKGYEALKD